MQSGQSERHVIGNWKMHPQTRRQAIDLAGAVAEAAQTLLRVNVGVAPTFLHFSAVAKALEGGKVRLGGQDVCAFAQASGAFTGDVSAAQLRDAGADFVILGHSERRLRHFEDNATLTKKIEQAFLAQLGVVFCVGESHDDRQNGRTLAVIDEQLQALTALGDLGDAGGKLLVAYEPLWAIGTGLVPTIAQIERTHCHIRQAAAGVSTLYGGSVTASNAPDLAKSAQIDGVLVGGAALDASSFAQIAQAFDGND